MKEYNKLVRDKIPCIINTNGEYAAIRHIHSNKEFIEALEIKLLEEVNEYLENKKINELCDIIEVIYAIALANNLTIEELETLRKAKIDSNGAFENKVQLLKVFDDPYQYRQWLLEETN